MSASRPPIRYLPRFSNAFGDGRASVPRLFGLPAWAAVPQEAWEPHDESYYYGGSPHRRLIADITFYLRWLAHGTGRYVRFRAFIGTVAVRFGGHPVFRRKRVSWGYGGERFRYDTFAADVRAG